MRGRLAHELDRRPTVRAVAPGLLLVFGGVLAFAGLLDAVWENDDVSLFDQPVLAALVASRGALATAIFGVITAVSGPIVLPAIVAVACLTWARVRHEWWRPLLLMGAMVTSTAISVAIKGIVARPRPPLDTMVVPGAEMSASFPSGHTIGAATLLLVTWYLVVRRYRSTARQVGWAVGTVVGTLAVGLSRMYLGYHFLTDVLAAIALAVAILGVVTIVDRLHTLRGRPQR
ncbi:phosphatase PAP2 family protein [Pengzhenrongella frigida]|uniref:Phosphatase PAP2 family protein n=1 Tax=Pengzhenrongella frigida TaxID=1259133 RepID=A0A4Q5N2Q8_9MICO|nr:phosphatase PAP2 family protein [Cellulomonas sp. HLT2-17]